MKPFDLQKALAGEPVVTRDGMEARIAGINTEAEYPLLGWARYYPTKDWKSVKWGLDGVEKTGYPDFNLFMAPVKKKGWVNVYARTKGLPFCNDVHDTMEQAMAERNVHYTYITTAQIEWEE